MNLPAIKQSTALTPAIFLKEAKMQPKVNELMNGENFGQDIGELFSLIANLMGVKNAITDINKADIKKMLMLKFRWVTYQEIYKAFENERFLINADVTEHFQDFSATYVAKILKKYEAWKAYEIKTLVELPDAKALISTSEKIKIYNNYLQICFVKAKAGEVAKGGHTFYEDFKSQGVITAEMQERAKAMYVTELDQELKTLIFEVAKNRTDFDLKKELAETKKSKETGIYLPKIANKVRSVLVFEILKKVETIEDFKK